MDEFQNVFEQGEIGDKFYMIIQGVVSIQMRNKDLRNWEYLRKQYEKLLRWKTTKFEPRVLQAKAKWDEDQKRIRIHGSRKKPLLQKNSTLN